MEYTPHVALVVGHRKNAKGAVAPTGLTEWDYNMVVAPLVQGQLREEGVSCETVVRPTRSAKGRSPYLRMVDAVNTLDPLVAISLHLNSASSPWASGSEVLCFEGSPRGRRLAASLLASVVEDLDTRSRGVKQRGLGDRGGPFLGLVRAPAVIVEPGFLSSEEDLIRLQGEGVSIYAASLVKGIVAFFREEGAL